MTKKTLIYDREITGHHQEFIVYLMTYLLTQNTDYEVVFLLHPDFEKNYPSLAKKSNYTIQYINSNELKRVDDEPSILKKTLIEWGFLKPFLERNNITKLFFMNLDPYQFVLGKKYFEKKNLTLGGILFRPFLRLEPLTNSIVEKIKLQLNTQRKRLQLKWILKNKRVNNVFILNDETSVKKLNQTFQTPDTFKYLADPVNNHIMLEGEHSWSRINGLGHLKNDTVVFLLFGSIDERKNARNILKAYQQMSMEQGQKSALLIAGKCKEEALELLIKKTIKEVPLEKNKEVFFLNRYVDEQEMNIMFNLASVVLIPYIGFFFSSGILGHAALHDKPVIAPDNGLIGELVEKYKLGISVDPSSINELTIAMQNILPFECNGKRYVNDHNRETFGATILNSFSERLT